MGWGKPYGRSMKLYKYLLEGDCDPDAVGKYWHRAFCSIAGGLGFGIAEQEILWDELVLGNWERLHPTAEESDVPSREWLEEFRTEVFYCSDRWSFDRLTRCHWIYRRYVDAVRRERGAEA